MADSTLPTWEERLGVQTLPIPVSDAPLTKDIVKQVYEQILGVTPTLEQMAHYDGLTVQDLYNDIAQQKEAVSQSAPSQELTDLSKYMASQTDPAAVNTLNTISALFNVYAGRAPSPEELQTYSTFDPTLAQNLIKELGVKEKEQVVPEPIFSGTNYMVMFSDDPTPFENETGQETLWLLNTNDHNVGGVNYSGALIPFTSDEAVNNFFQGKYTLQELKDLGKIVVRPTSSLSDPNSIFYNSRLVKNTDGIMSDGTMPLNEAVKFRHGKEIDVQAERRAKELLYRTFSDIVEKDPNFSQDYFDNAFENNKQYLAKYVNALAYGGYSVPDIYMDIMAHNKRVEGDPMFANYKGLSSTHNANDWKANNSDYNFLIDGQKQIVLPDMEGYNWDWRALGMSLWDIPDKAFKLALTPKELDFTDPDTLAEIEKIQTFLSDTAIEMAESDNKRDIAAAQYNWNQLKGDIEKSLNIQLSDNAYDAWNQLESLKSNMSQRGLTNSGVYNRLMDKVMQDGRRAAQRVRDAALDQKDRELRMHLMNGTSADIEKFIEEHGHEKAVEWGLVPDEETLAFWDIENLKETYTNTSEKDLLEMKNIILGETKDGQIYYRPTLDRNHLAKMRELNTQRSSEKTRIYAENKLHEEEKAKKAFTEGGLFDNIDYPDAGPAQEADSRGAQQEAFLNNWVPKKISGENVLQNIFNREIAAGRNPEAAVARTTSKDIYERSMEAERRLIGQWVANHGTPGTEQEWKAFRDHVYTTQPQHVAEQRPETQANQPIGGGASKELIEASKNFASQKQTDNTGSTGFQNTGEQSPFSDAAWESFKSQHTNKDWSGYERIASKDDVSKYKDVQNPGEGAKSLYGIRI